ncbi:hypothetical protein F4780DRAFT_744839 [Xylariomycetidae sp. FL0641]|nr:hypothetical protein F4780DRAFT_744839 [Xylariomycetidae sp. FL0641]
MDGYSGRSQASFDAGRPQMARPSFPPKGSVLVDAYRNDGLDNYDQQKPRYDPMNSDRVQSSSLVDLKDSVQVHLLTETALTDSKQYEILSQEEVDDLKKQCQVMNQRIEQTRSNLAVQSKYRDATKSMSRLYSPTGRGSMPGNRGSGGSEAAREAQAEREAIESKCEELASELFQLEKGIMEPQRRLLEHTAGILQLSHNANKKATTPGNKVSMVNGVPASPESMYTTTNGRNSPNFLDDGFVFDEASLYRSFDTSEILAAQTRPDTIEIPLKSPVRGQNRQLAEETDRLRDENDQLRSQVESLLAEINGMRNQESDPSKMISDTEQKLAMYNNQLREVIVKVDPARNGDYQAPPSGQAEPGELISSHLEYLENGLRAIGDGQGDNPELAGKIQGLGMHIQDVLKNVNPNHPPAPDASTSIDEQLTYLHDSVRSVGDELQRASTMADSEDRERAEKTEAVLRKLWDKIQAGYAEIRQRRKDRRRTRMDKGLEPDEEDMSESDGVDPDETYSLIAFESKIQWLYHKATKLQEQKGVLKRQIKQQRELNSKSDSEKDQQIQQKAEEIENIQGQLHIAEREIDNSRSQLSQALEDLEKAQGGRSEETAAAIEEAMEKLKERNAKIKSLETEKFTMQTRLEVSDANIETITAQIKEARESKETADKAVEEQKATIKGQEEELAQLSGMVAELKMEATLVKAELDAAYGSRKERAAEVAALHNNSESTKMQIRCETLEKELRATVKDLTDVVRQSVESEKKIGELETELDKVKSERANIQNEGSRSDEEFERELKEATQHAEARLEAEIERLRKEKEQLQEQLDGERFKAAPSPLLSPGGSKTSYLTDSYRVGLRAERKKYEEQLKAEQTIRRKIEDELRALKRAQGPGKRPVSQRT